MSARQYLLLAFLGLCTIGLAARFQSSPGYMDADYYFIGGRSLAEGQGFREQILWNYLDDPAGLPHPSHGYWMPLASLLAAAGMLLAGSSQFAAARIPFILLATALPPVTAALAWRLTGRTRPALLAGLLAVFPAFYLAYLPTTESFGIYMLLGGAFLLVCAAPPPTRPIQAAALGVLAGLMHLARADGLLWLVTALIFLWLIVGRVANPIGRGQDVAPGRVNNPTYRLLALCIAGYLLVMAPWFTRNLAVFGSPLGPGGSRALWLTDYDELFTYPAHVLSFSHWWSSGLGAILQTRLWALGQNLQTALGVQASIFLLPLVLAGLWRLRRQPAAQSGLLAWLLTLAAMSLAFPFQGARGGFFHSGAAVQPLFWAAAPLGLEAFVEWGARTRGWAAPQANRVFAAGLLLFAAGLTGFLTLSRLGALSGEIPAWDAGWQRYSRVEAQLEALGAPKDAPVMVNNAPGYYAAARRPALSIPYGDLQAVWAAAQRYGVRYLLVEIDQVRGESLYAEPGDRPGLRYLAAAAEVYIYEFDDR